MVFWRGTPDSLQLMCTVLFGLRVKDSWSWDIQESPSEKWGREIRDFQIIIIPTRLSIQKVRKGEKEQRQLTNPSERQKENPRAWHFQWQLEWTPETVTGTWATADKTQPQLCGNGRGDGGRARLVSELMKVLPCELCHFIMFLVQRIYQVPDDVIKHLLQQQY